MQKILYVEDDLSLIDGLQYTLEASGYMVDNAKTVKEALALFRKNTYDLLCWMLRSQMAQASMFAKRYGTAQPFPLYF